LGIRDRSGRRKQKEKEKESAPEPEEPREPTTEEPVTEGAEELAPEPIAEKAEEPTSEPAAEEKEELTPEPPTQEAKEPIPELAAEEKEELAPEPPAEEIEETTPQPVAEEAEELAPEAPAEKAEEQSPERRRWGIRNWFRRRKQKEKERTPEPEKPSEPVTEEAEELTPEPLAQEAKEPIPEPVAEEKEELAPEIPTQELEEPTPEAVAEETKELAPEAPAEKAEEPTPTPRRWGIRNWFRRKQKEKEKESAPEPEEPREPTTEEPVTEGAEEPTLGPITEEYQIFVNCEYAKWLGMFKDIGLETEVAVKTAFQEEAPLETRIDQVKEVLEESRSLANEIIKIAEQIYELIRSFYDQDLPKESQSIAFARKRLDEKATPWTALNVLFASLNNWNRQYKVQIFKSVDHLQNSLASIADLSTKNERLLPVLGDNFPIIMENAKKAENIKIAVEKKTFNVIDIMTIKEVFHSSLAIVRDVLSILYEKLKSEEKAIEILAPSKDFLWEKNDDLMKRMDFAMEAVSDSSEVKLSQVLESLPKFLSYVDECVETIALYNEIEELLLNYPIAEMAVVDLFREKKSISAEDLPFGPKYAEEYLKLFYSQRYSEFSLDKANMLLTKKA
jgi:hypothetical protein